ncbi:RDD family protein, partial [Mycobacteroides abscessus subsp. massiliense]|nr:RDD family protein [Mycobacteroides abscessus subsp. massiliense]
MSSPNDPGESGANERPVDQADLPPWQRAEGGGGGGPPPPPPPP